MAFGYFFVPQIVATHLCIDIRYVLESGMRPYKCAYLFVYV